MSALNANSNSTGNVYLNDNSSVSGNVTGAYARAVSSDMDVTTLSNASATGNVYLKGNSAVFGNVVGADARIQSISMDSSISATMKGNVYLSGNSQVSGNIYATYGSSQVFDSGTSEVNAHGNVSIFDNAKLQSTDANGKTVYNSEVWGSYLNGYADKYNLFTGNTFEMGASPIKVAKLGNFENYNFYLNDYNKGVVNSNTALVTVTDQIKNNDTVTVNGITPNTSNVKINGISGEGIVKTGDTIRLINAAGATVNQEDKSVSFDKLVSTKNNTVDVGLARKAEISYAVDKNNNTVIATIDNILMDKTRAMVNVKPLAEGRLAGLMNVTRGADLLMGTFGENKPVGTFTPIVVVDGGVGSYKSGSRIDSRDYRFMIGSRYQFLDNLYGGLALEYGRSNYDTSNHFDSGHVDGQGHTYNYGLSLFSKYTHDLPIGNAYVDSAFRFGRTSTEFKSSDIVLGSGAIARYKSKANYVGGILGTGYVYPINDKSSLDTSVNYSYTRLGSDSVVLDGDKVRFDTSDSSRLQFKEQYNFKATENLTAYVAGLYEYELEGKAKANISGMSADAPSVKGGTGGIELGLKGTPLAQNKNLSFNLNVKGYGGKRDGATVSALVKYEF